MSINITISVCNTPLSFYSYYFTMQNPPHWFGFPKGNLAKWFFPPKCIRHRVCLYRDLITYKYIASQLQITYLTNLRHKNKNNHHHGKILLPVGTCDSDVEIYVVLRTSHLGKSKSKTEIESVCISKTNGLCQIQMLKYTCINSFFMCTQLCLTLSMKTYWHLQIL